MKPITREMSAFGQICFETDNKIVPMCIDLVLPLTGDLFDLEDIKNLLQERLISKNSRFQCRVEGSKFIQCNIDIDKHVYNIIFKEYNENLYNFITKKVKQIEIIGDDSEMMKTFSKLSNERLDVNLPLWRAYLVNQGDKQYIFLRMHHCIGDGVSLATAIMRMDDDIYNIKEKQRISLKQQKSFCCCFYPLFLLFKTFLWFLIGIPLVLIKWIFVTVLNTSKTPELFKSNYRNSGKKKLIAWNTKDLNVDYIKDITHSIGKTATFNDTMLAAISGAFDRYSRFVNKEVIPTNIVVSIPVNIRRTLPKSMGNKIGGYMMKLPVGIDDCKKRSSMIYKNTVNIKKFPEQYASYWMFLILSYLPVFIVKPLFNSMSTNVNCIITNVRGYDKPFHFNGRESERLIGFVPPPEGVPVGIAISSSAGKVNITLKVEKGFIGLPSKFIDFIYEELENIKQSYEIKKQK